MKLALFIKNRELLENESVKRMISRLDCETRIVGSREDLDSDISMLLSIGGDGTFLSAAGLVAGAGIPVLGVNLGRVGFLSENSPEDVPEAIAEHKYVIEDREMLKATIDGKEDYYALNEVSVHRQGAAMLGVDVVFDGSKLPTYWADGFLVATSSGSTAYSLSVGGPICTPDSKVLILEPIAPHNLNMRPFIVPSGSKLDISLKARDSEVMFTADNRNFAIGRDSRISISLAQFSLKRVRLSKSNFVKALTTKLYWGEDIRNEIK